jgi:hypothetical protein
MLLKNIPDCDQVAESMKHQQSDMSSATEQVHYSKWKECNMVKCCLQDAKSVQKRMFSLTSNNIKGPMMLMFSDSDMMINAQCYCGTIMKPTYHHQHKFSWNAYEGCYCVS